MDARPPSQTARYVAVWRALHLINDDEPKIFRDIHARALAGFKSDDEMLAWVASNPAAANPNVPLQFALRHRYTEDQLRNSVQRGVGQYVILGAGLDSFGYSQSDLLDRLNVYEVDHPASQLWKRNRIAELGLIANRNLHYAPVDFEQQSLTEGLLAAGFDANRPAYFSCLGLTQYLTWEAIKNLFADVSALSIRSTLCFEFIARTLSKEDADTVATIARSTAAVGEPWLSQFDYEDAEGLLRQFGFATMTRFAAKDAVELYAKGALDWQVPSYFRMLLAEQ